MRLKRSLRIAALAIAILVTFSVYMYFKVNRTIEENENLCFDSIAEQLERGVTPIQIFQKDFEELQLLVEYSLIARSQMLEISNRLRVDGNSPISSNDLMVLKEGTEDYIEIREDLYRIAYMYECSLEVEAATLEKYGITPVMRLKGLMLSLGAALTLYDNYMLGAILFEQDPRLRRIVNDPDMGFNVVANKLTEMTLAANSIESRHRIRRAMTSYEEQKESISNVDEDSDFAYLETLIDSSPSYNFVKKIRVGEIASNKFAAFDHISDDFIAEGTKDGFDLVSGLFGNTAGLFESRKGKLYGNQDAIEHIQSKLKPLDILLEKTPFRLTDKLIPGHFGHVAIWTGTKAELIDIGIWDELQVKEYADQISSPNDPDSKNENQIIEALRSGVQLSTLDHFMNIDDFAILRPRFPSGEEADRTKEALIMAFRQVGKKYDFNFDVNTTDKIVCSELAYISFPTIDWPTEKTLGRHSISPDNVAKLAWNNVPLELVVFYHDGKLVDQATQVDKMIALMQ